MSTREELDELREDLDNLRDAVHGFFGSAGPGFTGAAKGLAKYNAAMDDINKSQGAQATGLAVVSICIARLLSRFGVPSIDVIEAIEAGRDMIGDEDHNGEGARVIKTVTDALKALSDSDDEQAVLP